jgi:hypothetical protein
MRPGAQRVVNVDATENTLNEEALRSRNSEERAGQAARGDARTTMGFDSSI